MSRHKVSVVSVCGKAVCDIQDADMFIGLVRKDGKDHIIRMGKLSPDAFAGFVVDLMGVSTQLYKELPKDTQQKMLAFIAQQAGVPNAPDSKQN